MKEQAAKLSGTCRTCDAPSTGWAVQLIKGDRLRWEVDWDCGACGITSRDGGWGAAPAEVRSAILMQHGSVQLNLNDRELRGGVLLKARSRCCPIA